MKLPKFVEKNKVRFIVVSSLIVLLLFGLVANYFNLFVGADTNGIARNYYVATADKGGKDTNPGTKDEPFLTLNHAQKVVRDYIASNDFTGANIYVREGIYELSAMLWLTDKDSGRDGYKVSYLNYPGEKPEIRGSKTITGWTSENNMFKTDLSNQIPADLMVSTVYFDGTSQVLAQEPDFKAPGAFTPNTDPYNAGTDNWYFASLTGNGYEVTGSDDPKDDGWWCSDTSKLTDANKLNLIYRPENISANIASEINTAIANQPKKTVVDNITYPGNQPVLDIFPRYDWGNSIVEITTVDAAQSKITTKQMVGSKTGSENICPKDRYSVKNFKAALDKPGEWYQDKYNNTNVLYFMPPTELRAQRVSVPVLDRAFRIYNEKGSDNGPHDIKIEGLTFKEFGKRDPIPETGFANSSTNLGTVILASNATNIEISNNTIEDSDAFGIYIGGASTNINIHHNQISKLAHSGILVSPVLTGGGRNYNRDLTPENILVTDNKIHDIATKYNNDVGIYVGHTFKAEISHNEIFDTPNDGIRYSANDTNIEQNYVHDVKRLTQDGGAIYHSGRLQTRGNLVQNNLIRNTGGYGKWNWFHPDGKVLYGHDTLGIYFDLSTGGNTVTNNIIINGTRGCLDNNGGSANTYTNNFCINSGTMNASTGTQVLMSENSAKGDLTKTAGTIRDAGSTIGNWQEMDKYWSDEYCKTIIDSKTGLPKVVCYPSTLDKVAYTNYYNNDRDPYFFQMAAQTTLANLEALTAGEFMVKNVIERNIFYYPDTCTNCTKAYNVTGLGTDQYFNKNLFYAGPNKVVTVERRFPDKNTVANTTWDSWTNLGFDTDSKVNEDPKFTNVQAENFTLLPDSPALAMGIQNIDIVRDGPNRVGPRPLTAPTVEIISPDEGSTTTESSVTVFYKVNGENAVQTFHDLTKGDNALTISAANTIDTTLVTNKVLNVKYVPLEAPVVVITAPADRTVVHENFVTIYYTVDGVEASQNFTDLKVGENVIEITAYNPHNQTLKTTVKITIIYEPTPGTPVVVITSPANGFVTYDSSITVEYTVDGVAGEPKRFDLNPGENLLKITATNAAGSTTVAVRVIYKEAVVLPPNAFTNGWNMVSFPDLAANISNEILPSSYKLRQYYAPDRKYIKGENEEITLTPGTGYWMNLDDVNKLNGIRYEKNVKTSVEASVVQGWNLIGNPFSGELPIKNITLKYKNGSTKSYEEAIKSKRIVNNVRKSTEVIGYVWSWNQKDDRWDFVAINPENYNTSTTKRTTVEPFRGFWMLIISDQISSIIINK